MISVMQAERFHTFSDGEGRSGALCNGFLDAFMNAVATERQTKYVFAAAKSFFESILNPDQYIWCGLVAVVDGVGDPHLAFYLQESEAFTSGDVKCRDQVDFTESYLRVNDELRPLLNFEVRELPFQLKSPPDKAAAHDAIEAFSTDEGRAKQLLLWQALIPTAS